MPFLPIANKGKIDKVTDSPKFGTVVDNNDPLKLGRVKVEITGIFEGSLQSLPWVRRKMDSVFCGADCEIFDVPEIGSVVEVSWTYDDNTPMYSGAPYNQRHQTGAFTGNYPHEAGIKFGDCMIKFDKASKLITIENGQAQIVIDSFGDVSIACANLEIKCDSTAEIHAPEITLDGNVTVTKSLGCLTASSKPILPTSIAQVSGGIITDVAP